MNILILSAMEEEIDFLVSSYELKSIDTINNHKLYCIERPSTNIYILNSGIGKVNSSVTTSMFLNKYKIDKLISIGTSGSLSEKTQIGDFVNGTRLAYHDVDVTAFGYEVGQLPAMDKYFTCTNDKFWSDVLNQFKLNLNTSLHDGDIITGDQFLNDRQKKQYINTHFERGLCVEMESTAIVHTAQCFDVDCYALRSISDNAEGEANISFDEYLLHVCKQYKTFVDILIAHE